MAVTATRVGNPTVFGDKKVGIFSLVFTGTYPDEGEAVTPATFGYSNDIELVLISGGVGYAADIETAVAVGYDHAADKFVFYEGSAAGTAFTEKTPAEAYPTNTTLRALVIGH